MIRVATEAQHTIYDYYGANDPTGKIRVFAMPFTNLQRVIIKAAINGHADVVAMLFDFAVQHCGLEPMDVIRVWTVSQTIRAGQAAVFDVLANVEPAVLTYDMEYHGLPLDLAMDRRKWGVVTVLFEHGIDARTLRKGFHHFSYRKHPLSLATQAEGTRMAELLLVQQKFPVEDSGALHSAAELGRLDVMRLLLEHKADVNETLSEDGLIVVKPEDKALYASWTPMHFAASAGQAEAMQLLESRGAQTGVTDRYGKTPAQLRDECSPANGS
ncbi:hypothetical protein B0A48_16844 [Cryoendolithus antarcticus]|uniref:Uncharacterized protein n=1 Tax=Cryoendolithus antarcticus TaxID=1507870 RepID=A0A1V8SDM7_9PEZI|nr:hypothetical protein B0A48_16844 [Cryoendolithus antarcticus]